MEQSITLNAVLRAALAIPAVVLLAGGAWLAVRLARADLLFRENTAASVSRAVELDPTNGRYYAWLAELLEFEGRDSTAALDAAARLNPMDSRVWIRRGLNAELAGKSQEAEKLLLHAAAIDRLLEPRWTLMNFYFRQGRTEEFWQWAKPAFAVSYGDRAALFELCWRVSEDASVIASRALPPDDVLLGQFLRFLMSRQQVEQAALIAEAIAPRAGSGAMPLFLDCVERLVAQGKAEQAVRLWNAISPSRLDPQRGESVTDGQLRRAPGTRPFDWHFPGASGVSALREAGGLRLTLSGNQEEACELLRQTMPLVAGRRYRLIVRYRTAGLDGASGVRVRVGSAVEELGAGEDMRQTLEFRGEPLAAVVFEYRRPSGRTRAEGTITVREVGIGFAE